MIRNNDGMLEIGGCTADSLRKAYGTPLYVYDESLVEEQIEMYKKNFISKHFSTRVIYASKAFLTTYLCNLLNKHNLSADVVSAGELYVYKQANFPMENIFFHGNNKSLDELKMALAYNVGTIIVDNLDELKLLSSLTKNGHHKAKTLLRVNPGIEAHTHEYIQTAVLSSKFGVSIFDNAMLQQIVDIYNENENIQLQGFHCHIGSQIFDENSFVKATSTMLNFIKNFEVEHNFKITKLNIGGGFGVRYTDEDDDLNLEATLKKLVFTAESQIKEHNLSIDELMIEPGRSIVNNAGVTLYTVGGTKNTFGDENYIFIDGGMADNIRPALYQAKYDCVIANKMNAPKSDKRSIMGKCCESGDIIRKNTMIQKAEADDILAVLYTGAYNYSMSNNYNNLLKPAVIFCKNGKSKVVVKRQSFESLISNDVVMDGE